MRPATSPPTQPPIRPAAWVGRAARVLLGVLGAVALVAVAPGVLPPAGGAQAVAIGAAPPPHDARQTGAPAFTTASRVTFGIEPASGGKPDGQTSFSFGATPGAVVNDEVAVVNYSSSPLQLQVYATDAIETSGGGFGLLPGGEQPRDVGRWVTLPPGDTQVDVPAASSAGQPGYIIVPLSVRVPFNASPGDHVGGVVASLQSAGTNASDQRILLDQRVGVRLFVQVAGVIRPKLAVEGLRATYRPTLNPIGAGKVQLAFRVVNAGNVDLAVTLSAAVSQPLDSPRLVSAGKIALLLPGGSVTVRTVVGDVWPEVLLHALVTAHPTALVAVNPPFVETVQGEQSLWAVPWPLIVAVVVVLVTLVLVITWVGRRRRARAVTATTPPARQLVDVR